METYDGDTICLTDNEYILKGITQELPIICLQGSSNKCIPTEKDFIKANKDSFGSAIGSITNKATAMYDVLAKFSVGSKEHKEIMYRLCCMQDYQQAEIDKSKGCLARPVLKEWYDWKSVKMKEDDSEEIIKEKFFNQSLLADKKPYFFIYNYATLKKEYMDYEKSNERVCQVRYGCSVKELLFKKYKTKNEEEFILNYKENAPVSMTNSTMNKLCWMIEEHYMNVKIDFVLKDFDCELLKNPKVDYSTLLFNKVSKLKEEYDSLTQIAIKNRHKNSQGRINNGELATEVNSQIDWFKEQTLSICSNEEILCNIVVDMCYKKSNKSKQFAWELCGEQMIENLLRHHDYKLSFPTQDEEGDIEFKGLNFRMEEMRLCD